MSKHDNEKLVNLYNKELSRIFLLNELLADHSDYHTSILKVIDHTKLWTPIEKAYKRNELLLSLTKLNSFYDMYSEKAAEFCRQYDFMMRFGYYFDYRISNNPINNIQVDWLGASNSFKNFFDSIENIDFKKGFIANCLSLATGKELLISHLNKLFSQVDDSKESFSKIKWLGTKEELITMWAVLSELGKIEQYECFDTPTGKGVDWGTLSIHFTGEFEMTSDQLSSKWSELRTAFTTDSMKSKKKKPREIKVILEQLLKKTE